MNELSQNIIQVAFDKFNQYGIRSVTIDDICKEVRISKKTFYNEFNNKVGLVDAVMQYHKAKTQKCFGEASRGKNAIETLIQIIQNIKKNVEKEPHRFYYDLEKYYPDVYDSHRKQQLLLMREEFEKNLRKGIDEGFYRDDMDVTMISLFHSLQKNILQQMMQSDLKFTRKQLMDFYIDVIVRLITNERGLKYIKENITD